MGLPTYIRAVREANLWALILQEYSLTSPPMELYIKYEATGFLLTCLSLKKSGTPMFLDFFVFLVIPADLLKRATTLGSLESVRDVGAPLPFPSRINVICIRGRLGG